MPTLAADSSLDAKHAQNRLRSYAGNALTRLRVQAAFNALALILTISAWTLVLFLFFDKLLSLSSLGINVWVLWGAFSIMGIPFVLWRMFSSRLHAKRAAVLADERLGLNARLSSALTLNFADPINQEFGDAFLTEATQKMSAIRVQQAFPIRAPRMLGWLIVPAMMAAGIFYFMHPQDALGIAAKAEAKRKAEDRKQIAAETLTGRLDDLKKKLDETKDGNEPGGNYKVNQSLKEAEKVAKDLRDGKRDGEDALQALGAIKQQIEDEKEKIERGKEFSDRLAKLQAKDLNLDEADQTRSISEALKNGDAGLAAKEMRTLAERVKKEILNDPKKSDEQKRKDLEKLKNELDKLAGALAEDQALRDKMREISRTSMDAAEFQNLENEIKKAEEKQNKRSNKKFGEDIEKEMEEAASELERLEEENDTKLTEVEKNEVDKLDEAQSAIEESMNNLAGEGEGQGKEKGGKPQQGQQGGKPGGEAGKTGKQGTGNGKLKGMRGKPGGKSEKGGSEAGGKDGNKQGQGQGQGQGQQGQGQDPSGRPGEGLGGGRGQGSRPYVDGENQFVSEKVKGELRAGAITGIQHFRGQGAVGNAPQEFQKAFEPTNKDGPGSVEMERIPADARDMVKDYFSRVREGAGMPAVPGPATAPPAPKAPDAPKPDAPKKEALKD